MANVSVKIDGKIVLKVKALKKKSGINVGKFFEIAAKEKIDREAEKIIPPQHNKTDSI